MEFWTRSLRIFKCLCDHGPQRFDALPSRLGWPRVACIVCGRPWSGGGSPEAGRWETEAGRAWLTRLVIVTLYTFGLKRGVGMETISEFFVPLRLPHHLGCTPTALRGVMQTLERTLVETAHVWEQEGATPDEGREIMGAVDETFLEHMLLVCMDLPQRISARGRGGGRSHLCSLESRDGRAAHSPRRDGLLSGQ